MSGIGGFFGWSLALGGSPISSDKKSLLKLYMWAREMGSVVKSIGYSSRGPGFNSQHPHGSLYLSVTPVPGDLI